MARRRGRDRPGPPPEPASAPPDRAPVVTVVCAILAVAALALAWGFATQHGHRHASWDGEQYASMAQSFLARGDFYDAETGEPTHHFPPLMPLALAAGFLLLPPDRTSARIVVLVLWLGTLAAVYLTTRGLFSHRRATVLTAVLATSPLFAEDNYLVMAEGLLAGLYALTLYFILRSMRRPNRIVAGGATAGLAYLTKSSVGPFFVLAGAAGLAWRLRFRGLKGVATDRSYLLAAAIFVAIVAAWTARNVRHFGLAGWETQPTATAALVASVTEPTFVPVLAVEALAMLAFLLAIGAPWVARPTAAWKGERESLLVIGAFLPLVVGAFFATGFHFGESRPVVWGNNVRYVLPSLVPLAWLCFLTTPEESRTRFPPRAVLLVVGLATPALLRVAFRPWQHELLPVAVVAVAGVLARTLTDDRGSAAVAFAALGLAALATLRVGYWL